MTWFPMFTSLLLTIIDSKVKHFERTETDSVKNPAKIWQQLEDRILSRAFDMLEQRRSFKYLTKASKHCNLLPQKMDNTLLNRSKWVLGARCYRVYKRVTHRDRYQDLFPQLCSRDLLIFGHSSTSSLPNIWCEKVIISRLFRSRLQLFKSRVFLVTHTTYAMLYRCNSIYVQATMMPPREGKIPAGAISSFCYFI